MGKEHFVVGRKRKILTEIFPMKVLVRYKTLIWQYLINLILLLVYWGGMLRKSFNCDTLSHMLSKDADVMVRLTGGRYLTALGDFLLLKLGLRTTTNLSVTMMITFLILAMAMLEIQSVFQSWVPEKLWAKIGFYGGINLVFINVLFAEPLMFSEFSVYYAIAYFTAAVGVKFYTQKKYIPMLLMYIAAVSFYQYASVFASIIIAFYICLDENMVFSRKIFFREIIGISISTGMGILNFYCIWILDKFKIVPFSKKAGVGDLGDKFSMIFNHIIRIYKNCAGLMTNHWFPLLFILGIWGLIGYSCIKERKYSRFLSLFIVWLGSNILLYVIPMAQTTISFYPRFFFCFFGIQGLLLVSAYGFCGDYIHRLLTLSGVLYLTVQLLFVHFIISDHFVSNKLDKIYANMVYEKIVEYEKETGNKVETIAVMRDIDAPFSYREVSYASDQINERALGIVPISLIYMVTGREFKKTEVPESIIQKYFYNTNWDYIDLDEQLIIEGDTAYWCIF